MTTYRRGDIVLMYFPNTNREKIRRRPALVLEAREIDNEDVLPFLLVQSDQLDSDLEQVIVASITSKSFRINRPYRILISTSDAQFAETGLVGESVIMTDSLATIYIGDIVKKIGIYPNMSLVDECLKQVLALT
jgi:mRNA interferase MazF